MSDAENFIVERSNFCLNRCKFSLVPRETVEEVSREDETENTAATKVSTCSKFLVLCEGCGFVDTFDID